MVFKVCSCRTIGGFYVACVQQVPHLGGCIWKETSCEGTLLCGHTAYKQIVLCAKKNSSRSPSKERPVPEPKSCWVEHGLDFNSQGAPWPPVLCDVHTEQWYMAALDRLTPRGSIEPPYEPQIVDRNQPPHLTGWVFTCFTWYQPSWKFLFEQNGTLKGLITTTRI